MVIHKKLSDFPKPTVLGLLSIYFSLEEIERLSKQMFDPSYENVFLFMNEDKQLVYMSGDPSDERNRLEAASPMLTVAPVLTQLIFTCPTMEGI
ncbi:hypothetical protein O9H85_15685 [Paenibacillus filicis]|uniref:Uncharacterized protein n=1 Tax=Paenibacillus gyeongsangnamensis TaxID=3388067 RepID=A0ABT4QAF0_9BACL|nr:hypothetical protein [Paenibacillus filicis]MCZ8513851.1 hypothetical protein [Paenibacillus filicis]